MATTVRMVALSVVVFFVVFYCSVSDAINVDTSPITAADKLKIAPKKLDTPLLRKLSDIPNGVSEECFDNTQSLNNNYLILQQTNKNMDEWFYNDDTWAKYCETNASNQWRIVCLLNFTNYDHDMRRKCESRDNAKYVEVDYTFQCLENEANRPGPNRMVVMFNARQVPFCVSTDCNSQEEVVESSSEVSNLVEEKVDEAQAYLESDGATCTRFVFDAWDVALVEAEELMLARMPSSAPTMTFPPLSTTECFKNSRSIMANEQIQVQMKTIEDDLLSFLLGISGSSDAMPCDVSLVTWEDVTCTTENITETILQPCDEISSQESTTTSTTTAATAATSSLCSIPLSIREGYNLTMECHNITYAENENADEELCELPYEAALQSGIADMCVSIRSNDDPMNDIHKNQSMCQSQNATALQEICTSNERSEYSYIVSNDNDMQCEMDYSLVLDTDNLYNNALARLCNETGGLYVESNFVIECTSSVQSDQDVDPLISYTTKTISYRLKPSCHYKECSEDQLEEVIRSEIITSIAEKLESYGTSTYCQVTNLKTIIPSETSENPESSFEGISEQCQQASAEINAELEVKTEKDKMLSQYLEYPPDYYCTSENQGVRDCSLTFDIFDNNLESMCIENRGQYVESNFYLSCTHERKGKELQGVYTNVPSCVGPICSPAESKLYLPHDLRWITSTTELAGWRCELTVTRLENSYFIDITGTDSDEDSPSIGYENPPTDIPLSSITLGEDESLYYDSVSIGYFTSISSRQIFERYQWLLLSVTGLSMLLNL